MPALWEQTWIKSLKLKNRAIRSATWSGVADERGFLTDRALPFYARLAGGNLGLIVVGAQCVLPNGMAQPYQIGNYCDGQLEGLTRLAETIHEAGSTLMAQLEHSGSQAKPELFPEEGEIWGASAVPDPMTGTVPKEMTQQDIVRLVEAYATAGSRAKRAGFDGVQLHAARGYGINQFLSPATNLRSDGYGGNVAKRYRFLGEILEAVRGAVGEDFPIFTKLSGDDYYPGGLVPEEALSIGRRLAEDGIDCIEVSGGSKASPGGKIQSRKNILKEKDEAYLAHLASRFKETVKTPVITVGGIRSPSVISRILADGRADYVALCRPLIREPHLMNRWKSGDLTKATCISCNGCYETGLKGLGISCKVDRNRPASKA